MEIMERSKKKKSLNSFFFDFDTFQEKLISVTNLRILSFEIYKFFLFYIMLKIISFLSNRIPFSIFFQINFDFYKLFQVFIFLLIVDLCYYFLLRTNAGHFSYLEIMISFANSQNIIKILIISILFCLLFLITNLLKSLMPRLDSEFIKNEFNIEPVYRDDNEENYYMKNGLIKSTVYEYTDNILAICSSVLFLFHFYVLKQEFWAKNNVGRIENLKNQIIICSKKIGIIILPLFCIIYLLYVIYFRSLLVFNISINYTNLFILEYFIFFISKECLNNFICGNINYICYEINTKELLIQKEIDFENEDNFYIIHYLTYLGELYSPPPSPQDIKTNIMLLKFENLDLIRKKIYFFIESINRKYSAFLNGRHYFYISTYMDIIDKLKINVEKILKFFDYSGNQVLEKETCIDILDKIIKLVGNIVLFIADAEIDKSNEEKYNEYSDRIYFFIERLFDIDKILFDLERRILPNELRGLRINIANFFHAIKDKQNKCNFIKFETDNIKTILQLDN